MKSTKNTRLARIIAASALFAIIFALSESGTVGAIAGEGNALYIEFALYLIPYLIAGYDVLLKAGRNIVHGHLFDENFLMSIATLGAFALVLFPDGNPHMAEGAAVMIFYQVGELFQDYGVDKSRASIASMMDIAPDHATVMENGQPKEVDPYDVPVGSLIIVKPGERIPLDGIVADGSSSVDTSALTGESLPREITRSDEVASGCINLTGTLTVETTRAYEDSTVARILDLVENAADKKARTENFITRFARWYTPVVCAAALCLAVIAPMLLGGSWAEWIERGLVFLVVSCPCALVISVPLSFFGGIGGASRAGILVKGSNYLEALSKADTVAFDKTGTLTHGTFRIAHIEPSGGCTREQLLDIAAHAEIYSTHPIAASIRNEASDIDARRVGDTKEIAGRGVETHVDGRLVHVGNAALMEQSGIPIPAHGAQRTALHVEADGTYLGCISVEDAPKANSAKAIEDLKSLGIKKTVMLTGDAEPVARAVSAELGMDEYRAGLLPQDKVSAIEELMAAQHEKKTSPTLAFVGDGINDAPVLTRADVGIAMGGMGSDAAIEAADVVLMDDDPAQIPQAMRIARRTMRIVRQNIIFALTVKFAVLALAAFGIADMWLAVFADVGVAVLAIVNAMRAMKTPPLPK